MPDFNPFLEKQESWLKVNRKALLIGFGVGVVVGLILARPFGHHA